MYKGRIISEDDPQNVRRSLGVPMLEVWPDQVRKAGEAARSLPGVVRVGAYGDRLHLGLANREAAASVVDGLARAGITVRDHREILPSLEDIFIAMVER